MYSSVAEGSEKQVDSSLVLQALNVQDLSTLNNDGPFECVVVDKAPYGVDLRIRVPLVSRRKLIRWRRMDTTGTVRWRKDRKSTWITRGFVLSSSLDGILPCALIFSRKGNCRI